MLKGQWLCCLVNNPGDGFLFFQFALIMKKNTQQSAIVKHQKCCYENSSKLPEKYEQSKGRLARVFIDTIRFLTLGWVIVYFKYLKKRHYA